MASNDIDTAAIRATFMDRGYAVMVPSRDDVLVLCDALDAARAELMDQSDRRMDAKFYADPELLVRAEAAEARIAAALELCDIYAGNETLSYYMPEIRRALTGTAR